MPFTKDGKNDHHHFSWNGSEDYQKAKYDLEKKNPYGN